MEESKFKKGYEKWNLGRVDSTKIRIKNSLAYAKYYAKLPTIKKVINKNIAIKDKYNNQKCFILGNGPSLKTVNVNELEGENVFCVNEYLSSNLYNDLRPKFYLMMDPAYYNNSSTREKSKSKINSNTDIIFFMPYEAAKCIEGINKFNNVYFINDKLTMYDGYDKDIDFVSISPSATNVVVYGIMVAVYLGFKEINLLGCDFNSFATPKSQHFYGESERSMSLEYELRAYSKVCREHRILKQYCENRGIKVYNCTKGSLLDVYDIRMIDYLYK